jgi:hypothetical protein
VIAATMRDTVNGMSYFEISVTAQKGLHENYKNRSIGNIDVALGPMKSRAVIHDSSRVLRWISGLDHQARHGVIKECLAVSPNTSRGKNDRDNTPALARWPVVDSL